MWSASPFAIVLFHFIVLSSNFLWYFFRCRILVRCSVFYFISINISLFIFFYCYYFHEWNGHNKNGGLQHPMKERKERRKKCTRESNELCIVVNGTSWTLTNEEKNSNRRWTNRPCGRAKETQSVGKNVWTDACAYTRPEEWLVNYRIDISKELNDRKGTPKRTRSEFIMSLLKLLKIVCRHCWPPQSYQLSVVT